MGASGSCGTAMLRSAWSRPGSARSRCGGSSCATAAPARVAERIRFTSAILPRWARRTRSLDALLPILYLRGISTGDFQEALAALLGKDAPNLSPSVIARLRGEWEADHARWQRRDLSARRYVYVWADGVYLQARMEPQAECMLVLIGATPEGQKELLGFQVGVRESAQSWRELLVGPQGARPGHRARTGHRRRRARLLEGARGGLPHDAASALLAEHKTSNVLEQAAQVRAAGHEGRTCARSGQAPDRATAEAALATFAEKYAPKYREGGRLPASRTATRCWPSTTSRPSTGTTCARPTRSRACSPPCGTARSAPRARCRRTPPS